MAWTKHPEMAMVERGQLRLAEPFNNCQDCSIDEANVRIGRAIAQGADPRKVRGVEVPDAKCTGHGVIQQRS